MSILSFLTTVLSLLQAVVGYLSNRRLIEAGEAIAIAKSLQDANAEIQKAIDTREAARRYNELNPDRLRDDDGFRRHD